MSGTAGAVIVTSATGVANGLATSVSGAGAGRMGAAADTGAGLSADDTGAAGAGIDTVVASTGAGSVGAPGYTGTSTAMTTMFGTTNSGITRTMVIASQ